MAVPEETHRDELVAALRALRRTSKDWPKASLLFECHSRSCAARRLTIEMQEGPQQMFQPLVKCPRCGRELVFTQCDPR